MQRGLTLTRQASKHQPAAILILAVAVLGLMAFATSSFWSSSGSPATPVTAFTAYVGTGSPARLQQVSADLGHPINVASDGMDQRSWAGISQDEWVISRWKNSGYKMMWSIPMLPSTGEVSLTLGATGEYDHYFSLLAHNLVRAGMGDSYLRIGWEFNQAKYRWYPVGQAAAFVDYWRQIVDSMRSVKGAHFRFIWNPSMGDNGQKDLALSDLAAYYPGDTYVDLVGMDVYDTAWKVYPGRQAEFERILNQHWGLRWLEGFGSLHHKPLAIPEMGLGPFDVSSSTGARYVGEGYVDGGDNPVFVGDVLRWSTRNHVSLLCFWDFQGSSIQNGQNPKTAAALRKDLKNF